MSNGDIKRCPLVEQQGSWPNLSITIPICSTVSAVVNYVFKVLGKLYFWSLKFGVKFNFGPSNLKSSNVVPQILKQ